MTKKTNGEAFGLGALLALAAASAPASCSAHGDRAAASSAAATNPGAYGYAFDAMGLTTSITSGGSTSAIARHGDTLTAGASTYRFDALGRVVAVDDQTFAYGADGQIDSATRAGHTASFVYDENGERILRKDDGVATTAWIPEGVVRQAELAEPVRVGGRLVGIARNGAFVMTATDVRGTTQADTDGTTRLASPFGERAQHPDVAPVIDFAAHEFDSALGAVRMGVRDYDARIARFLQPDPLFLLDPALCVKSPAECNLYGYARNRPADFVDATGTCAAPALASGQAGVCIEAFIAAGSIMFFGKGDDRTFAANDASKSARVMLQLVFDEKTGALLHRNATIASSDMRWVGALGAGAQGHAAIASGRPWSDAAGATHYEMSFAAHNGFFWAPGAPHEPILLEMGLRIDKSGDVRITGGSRSAYPSFGAYSYHLDAHGKVQSKTLMEEREHEMKDLGKWGREIPATPPGK